MDLNERWQRRKVERNTYLANLLTDAWPFIEHYREELTDAGSDLGLQNYDPLDREGPLTAEKMWRHSENPARDLGRAMRLTMTRGLRRWDEQQRSRQTTLTDAERTDTDTAYENLTAMLEEFTREDPQSVLSFVCNGVDTAAAAIWGVMEVAPKVFANQFPGASLTSRQLQTIIKNSYPLVVNLAAGNQELSVITLENLQTFSRGRGLPLLTPSGFVLTGEGESMALHITKEALDSMHGLSGRPITQTVPESDTTGCPALAARTPNGKNLVLAMWEWSMDAAGKAYFPRFDAVAET
jgi:hypothetical protein